MPDDALRNRPVDLKAYEAELRDLGFPEPVIREAVEAQANGLFDMEPSWEAVERTARACADLVSKSPSKA